MTPTSSGERLRISLDPEFPGVPESGDYFFTGRCRPPTGINVSCLDLPIVSDFAPHTVCIQPEFLSHFSGLEAYASLAVYTTNLPQVRAPFTG